MMLRVVALRRRINIVQFVPVEVPIPNELLRQLLVVFANFRNRRTERCQIPRHPRGFTMLIQHEPVRVLLHDLRDHILVPAVSVFPILRRQRQPPQLYLDSLRVEVLHHVLNRIARERVSPGLPVPVIVKPPVIQRRPVNPQLLQLRNRPQHLLRRDVRLISPAAPAHCVVLVIVLRPRQPFAFHGL